MIDMIENHQNLFRNLSFKYRNYLYMIRDPTTITAPPTSANSSRDSSVERSTSRHKKNYYHSKPSRLSDDAGVLDVTRWKESFMTAEIDTVIGLKQLHSQAYLEKNLISLRRPMQDQQEAQDPLGGLTE